MKVLALITAAIGSILITTQASPCIQPPDSEICSSPCIDGVFVLDVSKSIGNRKIGEGPFNLMKNLMINTFSLVTFSPNCSRAGLILFASDAKIEFNLTAHADKNSLRKALNGLNLNRLKKFRTDTGTNTAEGLSLLKNVAQNGSLGVNKEDRVKIAVIITDGRPSPSKAQQKEGVTQQDAMKLTLNARDALIKSGIYDHIYAIGVQGKDKKPIDKNTLTIIASNNESAFLLNNFTTDEFEEVTENIQFCNPCMSVQCPNGSKCRVWNETRFTYCEYSCAFDNGGCDPGRRCIEENVPTCSSDQCCSPVNVTCLPPDNGRENCIIEGQVYSEHSPPPEHQPTCNKPNRTYCPTAAPRPGCVCPNGTMIDEIQNKCVPLPECTCPPQCSHDYCSSASAQSSDTLIPCMRGFPPYTEADCTNDCKKTNCQLCDYYYRSPTDDPVYICI